MESFVSTVFKKLQHSSGCSVAALMPSGRMGSTAMPRPSPVPGKPQKTKSSPRASVKVRIT